MSKNSRFSDVVQNKIDVSEFKKTQKPTLGLIHKLLHNLIDERVKLELTFSFKNNKEQEILFVQIDFHFHIENFYDFIKTVSKLPAQQRMAEVGKIYSDKMQNKIAELAQQDIELRKKQVKPRGGTQEQVGRSAERLAILEDKMAVLSAKRFQESIIAKSRVISKGTINVDDAVERAKLNREVQNLSQFEIYARQAALTEELLKSVDQIRGKFMDTFLPALEKLVEYFGKLIDLTVLMIDWLKKIAGKTKSFFGG